MSSRLVILCGLPGAGKSTLARALSRDYGWEHLCRDRLRDECLPDPTYSRREKRQLNQWLAERARRLLLDDRGVIIDGMTFARGADRRLFEAVARALYLEADWLWLDCKVETAGRRVFDDRDHGAGDRTPLLVRQVAARFNRPEPHWHRIDAGQSPECVLRAVRDALRVRRSSGDRP